MIDEVQAVLSGDSRWTAVQADCLDFLRSLPAGSVDLVFGSPPYTGARLYLEAGQDLGIARDAEAWTAWMVEVTVESLRVCKGLVAWVVEGQTRDYRWDAAPFLLGADLARRGVCLRRPCYYRRSGIPGSGGLDWFRCDAEIVLCVTNGGKLPWADATACGHPPKWAPGGEMSHRLSDGQKVNSARRKKDITAPKVLLAKSNGLNPGERLHTKALANGTNVVQVYSPPEKANPGNVVQETYTAQQIDEMLGLVGEFVDCQVGGGQMGEGDRFSRKNEAPFPETLPERFIRSFCPPGGICLDPFAGSGTTAAVAVAWGRRAITCDLRQSQVELTRRRLREVTPPLFEMR